ncbi:tetratricopeptide repeat protein [Nodosilinea sp. P-1105]|uniref:tetratricopeptide repeat protein n=1 Tax=Nodosilinea sp. P-1105 TaxID=2546229 RepID=UPI00146BFB99|nr:tetratricopeptide repeat protein [Nodosilinea sp. P-1105]NMF82122.1 tetratricopeptide repeat protein [Nodosilinea sp. P-1105]
MTENPRELARTQYLQGQEAFDRGRYRTAIACFETAMTLVNPTTSLGGDIQIWLVNAYSAVGRQPDAIALCQTLTQHPDLEVRKQAKNLLYILQAPQLKRPSNWMSQIPDLGAGAEAADRKAYVVAAKTTPRKRPQPEPEPLDPSQINSKDNGFLWVALGAVALILGGLFWLG